MKRVLSVLLTLALAMSLTACGGGQSSSGSSASSGSSTSGGSAASTKRQRLHRRKLHHLSGTHLFRDPLSAPGLPGI